MAANHSGAIPVAQAFQAAGSGDFPVDLGLDGGPKLAKRCNSKPGVGLESPVHPQAGKPALKPICQLVISRHQIQNQ
jgi:hypothetical protein